MTVARRLSVIVAVAFLPPLVRAQEISVSAAGVHQDSTGNGDKLVYSNTLGTSAVAYGAGVSIADDLITTGTGGCVLSAYEFEVSGNTDLLGSGPFGVDFALWDGCPSQGGQVIEGTQGSTMLPDEGRFKVGLRAPESVEIFIPKTVWLHVTFTRDHAGWIGGAPALIGYSDDAFYFPPLGCSFYLGGYPPSHASMNARLYVRGDCPEVHFGYRPSAPRRGTFSSGAGIRMADDIEIDHPGCQMTALGLTVRGPAAFDIDLREADPTGFPGPIVPGTKISLVRPTNVIGPVRQEFDPPVNLPQRLWVTVLSSSSLGRTGIAGLPAAIGTSQADYAVFNGTSWSAQSFTGSFFNGSIEVSIECAGAAPLGACCDMQFLDAEGEAVCREVPRANCPYPEPGSPMLPAWREGATCTPDPFDPPCGTSACCLADGSCANLSENQCAPRGVIWNRGSFCDSPEVTCEFVCILSDDPCSLPHTTPGCIDPFCCAAVCSLSHQAFCCEVEWDPQCVDESALRCSLPPVNDECYGEAAGEGARLLTTSRSLQGDTRNATENITDPGFCCHGSAPDERGLGTVWFRFVPTGTTAGLRTCNSNSPASDSLLQVFESADHSSAQAACHSLRLIGCSDDVAGCAASGKNSRLCLRDLTPGRTYYIMVAAKTEETRGLYRLELTSSCIEAAPTGCECPPGEVRWVDPPTGTVDARRPHARGSTAALEGLSSFLVEAPTGSDRPHCWHLCETRIAGLPNAVVSVTAGGGNLHTLTLRRPMTPGAVTSLAYDDPSSPMGVFTSHPANVNGDGAAGPNDLLFLIDALNGTVELPWGLYSGDIDHTGTVAPSDLIELIDMLNGAASIPPWTGTALPEAASCAPSR